MQAKTNHLRNRILTIGRVMLLCAVLLCIGISRPQPSSAHPPSRYELLTPHTTETIRTVTTTADSGTGSFREALTNAVPGDRIEFDAGVFPLASPATITVLSELPHIYDDDLTIDAVGRGVILDGSSMPLDDTTGLFIHADNVTIQGLQIQGFYHYGISIESGSDCLIGGDRLAGEGNVFSGNGWTGIRLAGPGTMNNTIAGNIVGADPSGMSAVPNGSSGILVSEGSRNNTIGGTSPGYGNLISGNTGNGILVSDNGSDNNIIQGNLIGTDITGESLLGNGTGINIHGGPNNTMVGGDTLAARNIIAGNLGAGIEIGGISTDDTQVHGNYIGIDVSGTQAMPNNWGVLIADGAKRSFVGGDIPERRNIVSGNQDSGVYIEGSTTIDSVIQGNYIGTDPSGLEAIPNMNHGIEFVWSANTLVGGSNSGDDCSGACNLISGNQGAGIVITGSSAAGNIVQGNFIGSDKTGAAALGNGQQGVQVGVFANNNDIGGALSGEGNLIRYNQEGGVTLAGASAENLLTGNRIQENKGTAIRYQPGNELGVNDCSGNEMNLVEVLADNLAADGEEWLPQGDLTRYVVVNAGQGSFRVPSTATWGVGAGVEVLFDFGQEALIYGHLEAQGTADEPVVFGSAQRYAAPLPGDWLGLAFQSGSSGNLDYASVEFAQTGLSLTDADVSVSNSTVTASQVDGIAASSGSSLSLSNDTLAGNGRYALNNQTAATVDATGTWWGHASGPEGDGDAVNGNVNYSNWRTDPGLNDGWKHAAVLNPGQHSFPISSYQDLDWFRIPVGTRNLSQLGPPDPCEGLARRASHQDVR